MIKSSTPATAKEIIEMEQLHARGVIATTMPC